MFRSAHLGANLENTSSLCGVPNTTLPGTYYCCCDKPYNHGRCFCDTGTIDNKFSVVQKYIPPIPDRA